MPRNAPLWLACGLVWALANPCVEAAEPVRVCLGDVAHPPYRLADAKGRTQRQGLDFVFLDLLAQRSGFQIQSELLPGRRCLLELKAGQQDMLFSISYLPEREDAALFPMRNGQPDAKLALRSQQYVWYVLQSSSLRWDGRALQGLAPQQAVGAQTGYSISAHLREQGFVVDDGVRSAALNFEKLLKGRFAALAVQVSESEGVLRQRPEWASQLRRLDPPIQERHYFMALGHHLAQRSGKTPAQWWELIAEVRDSAAYRKAEAAAKSEHD
ncbi:polar amino acid transport system substrate-binding protein [Inhella inkyongensis]|uniref:Polar amino acid transport system substrate-binding protein n=1 Tax=Inhella inkyongensis TaxID=392593 RepID=A0A840S6M6_9BURK|nr:transporter substrate-binding domain-containing protein [Inhella inkyongensis]MBB5205252.1 polar amino acid transport system substrate-binding protein [Inhella inkyongensis]